MVTTYPVTGKLPLPEPPDPWVAKAVALARRPESLGEKLGRLVASLTFDSWSLPAPAGVRGLAPLTQRRIRFETESVSLEIRAEKKAQQWSFVAQATGVPAADCKLILHRRSLSADAYGFFQWSSKTPPRSLILTAGNRVIEVPELSWKMPKP